jgi:hypothetical protein
MTVLPISHPTRIYPDLNSLIESNKTLSRDDKILHGLEFNKVKFNSPRELTFTSLSGFNSFQLSDYSLKQFLDLLQLGRDIFERIRDHRLRAEVVNSILKDIAFDMKSGLIPIKTLRALTRRTDLRALFVSSVFPVQYLELFDTLKGILAKLNIVPLAVIIDGENEEFLNFHIIFRRFQIETNGPEEGTISYSDSSKELLKHLKSIDSSIGASTTLAGIKIIASDIGNPERMIVTPYILEVRCSNGMMMISPRGERSPKQLPVEDPKRKEALREFLAEVIKGMENRWDPLIESYKELQNTPIPGGIDPLDIIHGLRQFDQSGFVPARKGTRLGAKGRIFAAEDLRIYHQMMIRYKNRIRSVGDLINLISAGANGVYEKTKNNNDRPLFRPDVVWRSLLIQSASGILVTLGHDDPKRISEYIHHWSIVGKKVREKDMREIDMGDDAIEG